MILSINCVINFSSFIRSLNLLKLNDLNIKKVINISETSESKKGYSFSCISINVEFWLEHVREVIYTFFFLLSFIMNFTSETLTFIGTNFLHILGSFSSPFLGGSWTKVISFLEKNMLDSISCAQINISFKDFGFVPCKIKIDRVHFLDIHISIAETTPKTIFAI